MIEVDASKLRQMMLRAGWSARALAKSAGISITNLARLMKQNVRAHYPTIYKISRALGVNVDELVAKSEF